ncbi:hypothetical protein DPMN_097241 [Dreissena polymorpha]|uniref:Uncharacterized protein n=1 Tax=Dreissena polymorpha TaxID=45954 RepID=A0A9D4LA74_DREPO|nr:hypothetical protein DPMN_097241 [Dreissena polymorpha]
MFFRRCQAVSQIVGSPEGDSRTVYDGAKTVWAPALDFRTTTVWTARGDSQTVCDGAKTV